MQGTPGEAVRAGLGEGNGNAAGERGCGWRALRTPRPVKQPLITRATEVRNGAHGPDKEAALPTGANIRTHQGQQGPGWPLRWPPV